MDIITICKDKLPNYEEKVRPLLPRGQVFLTQAHFVLMEGPWKDVRLVLCSVWWTEQGPPAGGCPCGTWVAWAHSLRALVARGPCSVAVGVPALSTLPARPPHSCAVVSLPLLPAQALADLAQHPVLIDFPRFCSYLIDFLPDLCLLCTLA